MASTRKLKEKDLIDQILDQIDLKGMTQEEILGQEGLLKHLTGKLLSRVMNAEMDEHLGYEKNSNAGDNSGDSRNGYSEKTVLTENQSAVIQVPRDRNGTFEPKILAKHQRRLPIFNDQVISMYSFGMTDRDIKSHLEKIYNVEVSPELISRVTAAVMEEVKEWQNRQLEKSYAIVYLDALRVKTKQDGKSCTKSVYVALGVNFEGQKEVLGLWIAENEGAKFWMGVLNEIKNRGVEDILIACMDGLTGFPEAVRAVFPKTRIQLCIVHMVRNSTKFVSWKDLKKICADLKAIYSAATEEAGRDALEEFGKIWDAKYPMIYQSWDTHWDDLSEFFKYPPEIRKAIYTTNAIESLNYQLRKVTKNRSTFPNDDAIFKILYLAIRNASEKWTMPVRDWGMALNQFAIIFGNERVPF
ncbi:IS256 family transposase [Leadbettera azotonutricia]|uniref:Mutator family transposase n=2 Tax=Leadbettera azotonutricia (strain ATCC BAA-888 / DSM 13862 / ZAS-9) TaxID=545695 RepID=F5YC70_LEAAZ|nr:IS256 family transposase [Leadbettera azotonutricia]AEF80082.1 transposase, Mutator family [Leadbettera azotonutricia ZAS-9]AEF80950.1 transposase, Mutator family [Leadbettera azotonutricia ZAS-9]AEF81133.1 transposase, Mutator family [Leadbettera azotonutricia ZAS-9]AEF81541.1 transposase, Mutator family [Leadbettera azotonutricia ZAS-9]AEF81766.1 transposase, Mutator family [Leadbettera azotonutricia ZAS-9]